MRIAKLIFCVLMPIGIASCGTKTNADRCTGQSEQDSITMEAPSADNPDYTDLVKTVYEKFVLAIDADPQVYDKPEIYFTPNALKKLRDDYEFDCEDDSCYAYYVLRTEMQDSKPGSDDESRLLSVEADEDGWYVVSYLDMGWSGTTRIKIIDGKIDDYERGVADVH